MLFHRHTRALVVLMASMAWILNTQLSCGQTTATYQLHVRNDWSQAHHKDDAPIFTSVIQPHFSHLGGGTHNDDLVVWEEGGFSSQGVTLMQESGSIDHPSLFDMKDEFDSHLANSTADQFLNYPIPNPWFAAGTTTSLEFEIHSTHPRITLVSMLGPSPDWFIGVSGLELSEPTGWKQLVEIDLFPYDGGSRSRDDTFALGGPVEIPQQPIRRITDTDDTLIKGSLPIGRFTFELTDVRLLCDYDADGDCDHQDLESLYAEGATSRESIDRWLSSASNSENSANPMGYDLLRGDVDLDGNVNSVDLGLLLNNFGSTTQRQWIDGNLNDDAITDSVDLGQLLNNFGSVATAPAVVPEANHAALILLFVFRLIIHCRKRRK